MIWGLLNWIKLEVQLARKCGGEVSWMKVHVWLRTWDDKGYKEFYDRVDQLRDIGWDKALYHWY